MEACTLSTHSDLWSQLGTMQESRFKIGDRQNEKKQSKSDQMVLWKAMRWNDAGRWIIRHAGVSEDSDAACRFRQSHSAWTDKLFCWCPLLRKLSILPSPTTTVSNSSILAVQFHVWVGTGLVLLRHIDPIKQLNYIDPMVVWAVPHCGKLMALPPIQCLNCNRVTIWYIHKRCSLGCPLPSSSQIGNALTF